MIILALLLVIGLGIALYDLLTLYRIHKVNKYMQYRVSAEEQRRFLGIIALAVIAIVIIFLALIPAFISTIEFTDTSDMPDYIQGWAMLGNLFIGLFMFVGAIFLIIVALIIMIYVLGIIFGIFCNRWLDKGYKIGKGTIILLSIFAAFPILGTIFIFGDIIFGIFTL